MITITNVLIGRNKGNFKEKGNHINYKRNYEVQTESLKEIYRRRVLQKDCTVMYLLIYIQKKNERA